MSQKAAAVPAPKLSGKDMTACRAAQKFMEAKAYKKALKQIDKVLSGAPKSDRATSLKGLILYNSGKKDEGRALANEGLKLSNFGSFYCWKIRGSIRESDGEIAEAIVCLKNALTKEDTDDEAADLRHHLSVLQFIAQDYVGFLETRTQILLANPSHAQSWGPCAVGAHLMNDLPTAQSMMDRFISATRQDVAPQDLSELLFYKIALLRDAKEYEQALALVAKEEPFLLEKRRVLEVQSSLLLQLGRGAEAEPLLLQLLEINSEDAGYLSSYAQSKRASTTDELIALYANLQTKFPRSQAVRRVPLDILPGWDPRFKSAFAGYYRALIEKGAPSCFASVKSLYSDPERVRSIQEQVESDLTSLRASSKFAGETESTNPTSLLWLLYFAAQHYDRLGQWSQALTIADEALRHTPTLIDIYIVKARLAKHIGDNEAAFLLTDRARELDTADRWLNSHCVHYALAADHVVDAEVRMGMFAKADDGGGNNTFEMQNEHYMLSLGQSYLRQGKPAAALKILIFLLGLYDSHVHDHLDLMQFSMRQATVGTWYEMGRAFRDARSSRTCLEATRIIVDVYLGLQAAKTAAAAVEAKPKTEQELEQEWAKLSPKTRKVAKQEHRRKTEAAAAAAAASAASASASAKGVKSLVFMRGDPDPVGEQLYSVPDPLAHAHKYALALIRSAPSSFVAVILAGRVAVARGKFVQALGYLSQAHSLGHATHPDTLFLAATILEALGSGAGKSALLAPVLAQCSGRLFWGLSSLPEFVAAWAAKPFGSEVAHVLARFKWSDKKQLSPNVVIGSSNVGVCLSLLRTLQHEAPDLVAPFKAQCVKIFPSPVFGAEPNPLLKIADVVQYQQMEIQE